MSSQPNGFDPNQKRDGSGRFAEIHGSRPASGALSKPPAEWPEDAWPDDSAPCSTCGVNDAIPGDGKCQDCLDRETAAMAMPVRECRECGRPVTIDGNTCQACVDLNAQIAADYPDEDEHAQMQAAADRAKQLEAEVEAWEQDCVHCGQPALYQQATCGRPACEVEKPDVAAAGTMEASFEEQYARAEREHEEFFEQKKECAHCDQPHHADGLCKRHYDERRYGRTGLTEGSRTPWGATQTVYDIAPGINFASTAGHGGYKLSPQRNREIPAPYREASGWYEEDGEWRVAAATFPEEFASSMAGTTPESLRDEAEQYLRDYLPEAWEKVNGTSLQPGQSREKDQRAWRDDHANDFVIISRATSETDSDMLMVSARRHSDGAEAEFLMGKDEHARAAATRPDGQDEYGREGRVVIDPNRHARLPDAPPVAPTTKTDALLGDDDLARLRGSAKGRTQERIEKDLRQRWRSSDGQVRTLEDLLKTEGVHQKTVFITDAGGSQYSLVQASGSSMRVSKATWDGLTDVPDRRPQSEKLNNRIHQIHAKLDKLRDTDVYSISDMQERRVKARSLTAELEAIREARDNAAKRERAAYEAEHGSWDERQQRSREAQAKRERLAQVNAPA